jgi:hypothetical protein
VSQPEIVVESDSEQTIGCIVDLTASVSGGGTARWNDARFRWYAGTDSLPFDSSDADAEEIRRSWGADTIATEQTRQSGWSMWASIPFRAEIEYRYLSLADSAHRTATVRFECGVAAPAAPPRIDSLALRASDLLEPGDVIEVAYSASSSIGIWASGVFVHGACTIERRFAERQAPRVSRTVSLTLPPSCQLGQLLYVTVVAWDAALVGTQRSLLASSGLADTTPPTLYLLNTSYGRPGGDFAVGDTVPLYVNATDNHALRMLYWENLDIGSRDSLALSGTDGSFLMRLVVRPEWVGAPQFRFTAVDASGNHTHYLTDPDAFHCYRRAPAAWATTVGEMDGAIHDARRNRVYLLQHLGRGVFVFDVGQRSTTSYIALTAYGPAFDITASGDSLVVAGGAGLQFIDLETLALSALPVSGIPTGQRVEALKTLANGKVMIQTCCSATQTVSVVDLATAATDSWQPNLGLFDTSRDRNTVIFVGYPPRFVRYDVATGAYSTAVTPDSAAWTGVPSVDAAGVRFTVNADVWENFQLVSRVHGAQYYAASAISPDGRYVFVAGAPGVIRARASDGRRLDAIPMAGTPTLLRVSEDGRWLLALIGGNRVTVYDLAQLD